VTGGFLGGVDVNFARGLNVVIGGRGAGKTTLLEFIRHALGLQHADESRTRANQAFIRTLLGSGEIVLDLESDEGAARLVVDGDGGGRRADLASVALMLGQNELESIASSPDSRLNLIDLRARVQRQTALPAAIGDATQEMAKIRQRLQELGEQTRQRASLQVDFDLLSRQESELLAAGSEQLATQRESLRVLENHLLQTIREGQQARAFDERVRVSLSSYQLFESSIENLGHSDLPEAIAQSVRTRVAEVQGFLQGVDEQLLAMTREVETGLSDLGNRELDLRARAEPIRAALDEAERGLGEITARLRNYQAQLERLDQLDAEILALETRYQSLKADRDELLDAIEGEQESIFAARQAVASTVSNELGGRVTVVVEHLADSRGYRDLLDSLLQGSGLQYHALSEVLSRTLLPRQLLVFVESRDEEGLASVTGISEQRAARVIENLETPDSLIAIAEFALDDRVDFRLLDGATTKSVERLSTGQKCAVTLPILLTEHTRTLILDQPEDHLDNAYLVSNIVMGLNGRSDDGVKTIIATHNANIPVLGSAQQVIALQSDGSQAFVTTEGEFDVPEVVEAITTLMEGGKEAFQRRATFYRTHGIDID